MNILKNEDLVNDIWALFWCGVRLLFRVKENKMRLCSVKVVIETFHRIRINSYVVNAKMIAQKSRSIGGKFLSLSC